MSDISRAKKIIDGLVSAQKNAGDRLQNVEKQVEDLKTAQRIIDEATQAPMVYSDESEVRNFVNEDGSVQWKTETKSYLNGRGHRVQIEEAGLLDCEDTYSDWHSKLKKISSDRKLARMLMTDPYTPKLDMKLYKHLMSGPREILPSVKKAFNNQAGSGQEFIPDQFVSDLYQAFEVPTRLRALLTRIQADRNTLLVPRLQRGGRPYLKQEILVDSPLAQYTSSTPQTGDATINIKGMAVRYVLDDAAVEDAALSILPIFSQQISDDLNAGFEDACINGDSAATHQDDIANWNIRSRWGSSGLGGASDHRRAFLGLRAAAADQSNSLDQGTSLTIKNILAGMATLGELGTQGLVMVVSPEFLVKHLIGLSEVLTIDKFANSATILSGQIASIFGIPVILSRYLSADLESTGLFLNSGSKDRTGYLLFNASSYYLYERRGIVLEQDKNITAGAINLVSTYRATMASPDQSTTKNVFFGRNFD
tara:strand:+ start:4597 stop:6039 length:1443 start_codon:yes stop_codon:yes gene_type:complete